MAIGAPTVVNQTSSNPNYIPYIRDKKSDIDKFYFDAFEIIRQSLQNQTDAIKNKSIKENFEDLVDWFKEQGEEIGTRIQKEAGEKWEQLGKDIWRQMFGGVRPIGKDLEQIEFANVNYLSDNLKTSTFSNPVFFYKKVTRESVNNYYKSKSHQIESILRSGADFLSGHFDAILIWYNDSNEAKEAVKIVHNEQKTKADYTLNVYGFAVRLTDIDIPAKMNDTFQLKTSKYVVEKIRSTKTITKQASFKFRLDQNLEWLRFFNDFSGYNVTISHSKEKNFDLTDTWQDRIGFFPKSFYVGNNTTSKKLCLIVSSDIFESSYVDNAYSTYKRERFQYVFEDVKFLGSSDIEYSNSASDPDSVTVDFIFKRLRKVSL